MQEFDILKEEMRVNNNKQQERKVLRAKKEIIDTLDDSNLLKRRL